MYRRVNLRGLRARQLLEQCPPSLWALVPLTRDGATETEVQKTVQAIAGRPGLSPGQRADHLAVLWFLAEAENVPIQVMQAYISREVLMESALYRSIFEEGQTKTYASTILRVLMHRLGAVDPAVREHVQKTTDPEQLNVWYEEALMAVDAETARRLASNIKNAAQQPAT